MSREIDEKLSHLVIILAVERYTSLAPRCSSMLNSFDKRPVAQLLMEEAGHDIERRTSGLDPASDLIVPPQQGIATRLLVRRWLIVLFVVIISVLAVSFALPWQAAAAATLAFAGGAAAIPRSGLPIFSSRVRRSDETLPLAVAKSLIDGLPEPAILLAPDAAILAFNDGACDLFGVLRTGVHLSSATRSPQVLGAVEACDPDRPLQTVTLFERFPVERHLAATASWLSPPGSKAGLILLLMRDLTEQRRLDQLRADFIANASHELKTPLASLLGFIDTLRGAARDDEAARERFLAIMAKQGQRMARLIDNLMSLSRIEMRAHLRPLDSVAIGELVLQACETLEPMAVEAGIEVTVQQHANGAAVLGDRDELTQVIINLLHNAIKYGKRGGSVLVIVRRLQNGVRPVIEVAVEDDGPGIASQHLPRLTERFYRVSGFAAQEKGGTGLGLAIVKHVVNRHRGELRVQSEEGAGSKFIVQLEEHIRSDVQ